MRLINCLLQGPPCVQPAWDYGDNPAPHHPGDNGSCHAIRTIMDQVLLPQALCVRAAVPSRGCSLVVSPPAAPSRCQRCLRCVPAHGRRQSRSWLSPKRPAEPRPKRRGVRVISKAGAHLERADGLEGIPVIGGNQEIIHSGGSANVRG